MAAVTDTNTDTAHRPGHRKHSTTQHNTITAATAPCNSTYSSHDLALPHPGIELLANPPPTKPTNPPTQQSANPPTNSVYMYADGQGCLHG